MPAPPGMACVRALLLLGLCLTAPWLKAAEIIVAASHETPALHRFIQELQQRRPHDSLRLAPLAQLPPPSALPAESRLILLGEAALAWRLSDTGGPPTLTLQVNRVQARQQLGDSAHPSITLLWSDPPAARQLRLIRQLLPSVRRIGLLYGHNSRFLVNEIRAQATAQGFSTQLWFWPDTDDSRPLNRVLDESEVLLGIDDPDLYNSLTIKSILLASYSRKRPLIGPTAAFVRAGSLSSSYSDQQDWLDTLDELLDQPPRQWPQSAYPTRYKVLGNARVAHSLAIETGSDTEQAERLQRWEGTP